MGPKFGTPRAKFVTSLSERDNNCHWGVNEWLHKAFPWCKNAHLQLARRQQ